jgi:hypothetical protein
MEASRALGAGPSRTALKGLAYVAAILGAAVLTGILIQDMQGRYALVFPILLVAAWVAARRPAGTLVGLLVASSCVGLVAAYTPLTATTLADLLLLALWLGVLWGVIAGRTRLEVTAFMPGVVLITAYLAVSLVQALLLGDHQVAVYGFRASQWYLAVAPLMIVAGWWTRGRYLWFARAIVVLGVLVGLFALFRYITGPAPQETAVVLSSKSATFEVVHGKLRLFGSFASSKALAGWAAQSIPLLIGLAFALRGKWRIATFAAMGLLAIGMFGSDVRGAVVAVVPAVGIVLLLAQGARGLANVHLGAALAATVAVGLLGIGAFAFTLGGSSHTADRYRFVLSNPSKDPSFQGRLVGWRDVWRDVPTHPVGHGIGTSGSSQRRFGRFQSRVVYASDNGYLRVAYEQGSAVMVLFVVMLVLLVVGIAARALTVPDELAAGVGVGVVGSLIAAMFYMYTEPWNEGLGWLQLWVLVGFALVGLTRRLPSESAPASAAS